MRNNDFLLINDIIHRIYTLSDFDQMRETFLSFVAVLIPNQESSIFLSDHTNSGHLICDPVIFPGGDSSAEKDYLQFENLDYTRWVMMSHKCMIFRESDLISDEERSKTDFFKNLMAPNNIYYSLQLVLVYQEVSLGVVTLYRSKETGDFTDEEVFILDSFKEHLNYRFYQYYLNHSPSNVLPSQLDDLFIEKYHLTKREKEILVLTLDGVSNNAISDKLSISPHTLKKHMQNLYRKLNVTTKWELLQFKDK
ncbi:MAG: LuxR C-terminal-related transcriptional regulator [Velocimicrobium sp.]